jgi:hypothetical protein
MNGAMTIKNIAIIHQPETDIGVITLQGDIRSQGQTDMIEAVCQSLADTVAETCEHTNKPSHQNLGEAMR